MLFHFLTFYITSTPIISIHHNTRATSATPKPIKSTGNKNEIVNPGKKNILGSKKIPPTTINTSPAERRPAINIIPIIINIIGQEKIKWVNQ